MELLEYHMSMEAHNILTYYKGPFDELVLSRIGDFLRNKFPEYPRAGKRLFSVFIEMAQNISYYSAETNHFGSEKDKYGVGTVMIYEDANNYVLTAGNLIEKTFGEAITERCKEINTLNTNELRKLKKELRSKPRSEGQKGGNIGLVHMALKSGEPLEVETKGVDEQHSFFILTAKITKAK